MGFNDYLDSFWRGAIALLIMVPVGIMFLPISQPKERWELFWPILLLVVLAGGGYLVLGGWGVPLAVLIHGIVGGVLSVRDDYQIMRTWSTKTKE